jgi:hypothetical protein
MQHIKCQIIKNCQKIWETSENFAHKFQILENYIINSEYFSQLTTCYTSKILFLEQIFFTASWDHKNTKVGTKKKMPNKISRARALKFHSCKIFKVL